MSRKLDMAIAEVLGWTSIHYNEEISLSPLGKPPKFKEQIYGDYRDVEFIPRYSTDGNAMLELDREMRERGLSLSMQRDVKGYLVIYWSREKDGYLCGTGVADTMPKAVALAAYKVLTGKEWKDE